MSSSNPFLEFPQMKPPLFMMGSKAIKWKANTRVEVAPNCPRCFSSNTKFCYYNNYSVSQPRFFCKSCRRYWTKGGSLRNVPIGGKTRRSRSHSRPRPTETVVHAAAAPPNQTSLKDDDYHHHHHHHHHHHCSSNSVSHDIMINGGDQRLHGCLDGQDHFVYQNFDVFEVEGVNNLGSEMLWSNLESFGCQQPPLMEMQEFEVFSSDDHHLRMSDDNFMATDNWGSFDLSAYENF